MNALRLELVEERFTSAPGDFIEINDLNCKVNVALFKNKMHSLAKECLFMKWAKRRNHACEPTYKGVLH